MLTVPHALVGAALGAVVQNLPAAPLLSFGLGWASHYVMDTIPHWERVYKPHQEIDFETDQPARDWPKHIFVQAALDVLIAAGIIVWLFSRSEPPNSALVWGAVGGALPDLLDNVPYWNKQLRRLPFFSQEFKLHEAVHISRETQNKVPKFLGLITQLAVIVVSIFIIFAA